MSDEFWEQNFGIKPHPVDDLAVWRVAHQMRKMFPEDISFIAAQRADKAMEMGDMSNFNLWTRITKAIEEIERQRPRGGEALN